MQKIKLVLALLLCAGMAQAGENGIGYYPATASGGSPGGW